jgi:hypothetical protein
MSMLLILDKLAFHKPNRQIIPMLKKILIALVILVAILLVIIARQPAAFRISRSMVMNASPVKVFAQVNDFHNWEAWSPWAKLDPESKVTFEGAESGQGAIFKWAGNDKVGEGRQEIIQSKSAEFVRIKIDFIKPFPASNDVEFTFQPEGNETMVTWSMSGKNNFLAKAVTLVIDCEKMVAPDFEKGLANLKAVVEAPPKP